MNRGRLLRCFFDAGKQRLCAAGKAVVGFVKPQEFSEVVTCTAALAPALVLARRPARLELAFAVSVAGFLAFTKVLSPQYLVWLIPLVPFGGAIAWALLAAALVLAQSWYFHYHDLWAVGPQVWTLLARDLVLVALFVVLSAELAGRRAPRLARRRAASPGSAAA